MSRSLAYHLLDVFTDRRFSGNPLAVVEDADGVDASTLQAVAREFNLSETVFLLAPRDPVMTARIRIFTPTQELPFAGHPTIGAAALLAETRGLDALTRNGLVVALESDVGALRCDALRGRSGVTYAELRFPGTPRPLGPTPSREALAAALTLAPADIGFEADCGAHVPSVYAAGPAFVFVPVASRAALDRARPVAGAFGAVLGALPGAYLYTPETIDPAAAIHARMFAHGLGFEEDPATGAAAVAFAAVAQAFERPEEGEHELFIEQGHAMGRPSRITLRLWIAEGALAGVAIGGQAVRVGEGRLRI
ncbi:MAG: PhzF family phenazine biosynthesis protein [Methylocystis sp.]|uniref:PhzF family phenazine biosynthesis protein n=1 Tax=Methylocystis sp. TaxID=1911079 RepID=UPI003DA50668